MGSRHMPVESALEFAHRITHMALTSGTRLGPYEIVSPLGAGPSTRVKERL